MKSQIFLILGVIGLANVLYAGEQDTFYTQGDLPVVEQEKPRWKDSLAEIQKTTTALLETNRKLSIERQSLRDELTALETGLADQRKRNDQLRTDIQKRQADPFGASEANSLRDEIAFTEKAISQKKKEMASFEAKVAARDSTLMLRRLKIKELEIEKKSILVDRRPKDEMALSQVRLEVRELAEKIASLKGQTEYVRGRIAAFRAPDDPQTAAAAQIMQDNAALREQLARLRQDKSDLLKQVDQRASGNIGRYTELKDRKEVLEKQIASLKEQKNTIETAVPKPSTAPDDLSSGIKTLEEKNKLIEDEISNLRENIAVLEYKISSIERYKDRNKDHK